MRSAALLTILLTIALITPDRTRAQNDGTGSEPATITRSKPGPVSSSEIAQTVALLARNGSFREAEQHLQRLRRDRPVSPDGFLILELVYLQLASADVGNLWDAWCAASPDSAVPLTIRSMHLIETMRHSEKSSATGTTDLRRQRETATLSGRAKKDLENAYLLNPDDPAPAAALAELAVLNGVSGIDPELWFARAISADPAWMAAYQAKLKYLAPWHHGSAEKMLQFARQCLDHSPPGTIVYTIALEYLQRTGERLKDTPGGDLLLLQPQRYAMATAAVRRYRNDFPDGVLFRLYQPLLDIVVHHPYEAIAAFSAQLFSTGTDEAALLGRSTAYQASGQFQAAEQDLRALLALNPNVIEAHALLGHIFFAAHHDPDHGRQQFDQALKRAPGVLYRAELLVRRGTLFYQAGQLDEAATDLNEAIGLAPDFADAYLARARLRHAAGDQGGAVDDLLVITTTLKGPRSSEAKVLLETYLQPRQQPAQPHQTEARATTDLPDSGPLAVARPFPAAPADQSVQTFREALIEGTQASYNHSPEQAQQAFHRAISILPDDPRPHFLLGKLLEQSQYPEEALAAFHRAVERAPGNTEYATAAAGMLLGLGSPDQALKLLASLPNSGPNPEIAYYRGLSLQAMGKLTAALQAMGKIPPSAAHFGDAQQFIASFTEQNKPQPQTAVATPVPVPQPSGDSGFAPAKTNWSEEMRHLLDRAAQILEKGDLKAAKTLLFDAVRDYPHSGASCFTLGKLFSEREHDDRKALTYFNQAIEREPDIAAYHRERGLLLYRQQDCQSALADFDTALRLGADDPLIRSYRGRCIAANGGNNPLNSNER